MWRMWSVSGRRSRATTAAAAVPLPWPFPRSRPCTDLSIRRSLSSTSATPLNRDGPPPVRALLHRPLAVSASQWANGHCTLHCSRRSETALTSDNWSWQPVRRVMPPVSDVTCSCSSCYTAPHLVATKCGNGSHRQSDSRLIRSVYMFIAIRMDEHTFVSISRNPHR